MVCRDEILISGFATFGGCLLVYVISIILLVKRLACKSPSRKLEDVKGRRNNVFEVEMTNKEQDSQERRKDSGFIASSNESIVPFNDITSNPSSTRVEMATQTSDIPAATVVEAPAVVTSVAPSSSPVQVLIEKKHSNCTGLDFGIAGIFVKKVDTDEINFKEGILTAGDEVVLINGTSVQGMNDIDVFSIFAQSADIVTLHVNKGACLSQVSSGKGFIVKRNPSESSLAHLLKSEHPPNGFKSEHMKRPTELTLKIDQKRANELSMNSKISTSDDSSPEQQHARACSEDTVHGKRMLCNGYFARAQSEENIRSSSGHTNKRSSSQDASNEDYIQYLYEELIKQQRLDQRNLIVQRGYNSDYILPLSNGVPVFSTSLTSSRRHSPVTTFPAPLGNTSYMYTQPRVTVPNKPPPNYPAKRSNSADNLLLQFPCEGRYQTGATRKEPPPYPTKKEPPPSYPHEQMEDGIMVRRSKSIEKNRPHSCNDPSPPICSASTEVKNNKQPKRTHSMPAVKHIEKRPRLAKKVAVENGTTSEHHANNKRPKKLRSKCSQQDFDRRKSIDSGTLQKLAKELQEKPELGGEYPMISHLLGESHFAASERRGKNLYRHKSTEAIHNQPEVC